MTVDTVLGAGEKGPNKVWKIRNRPAIITRGQRRQRDKGRVRDSRIAARRAKSTCEGRLSLSPPLESAYISRRNL